MWGRKIEPVKKLARKVKSMRGCKQEPSSLRDCLLGDTFNDQESSTTPTGMFAVYVGEDRQRFVVPMSYLGHPLFKMLLEKASEEYGFNQKSGLAVPCSVATFQEVISAVQACNGKFEFGDLVEDLL